MIDKFLAYIKDRQLFNKNDKLIVAISGGVDSVVLANLCHEASFDFVLAHCNFNLREQEVENETLLVKKLSEKYKVAYHIKGFGTSEYAEANKLSIQVAARELRYAWFDELLKETGRDYLLTAHHSDDNIETVLMNFFKGTGVQGLRGIMPKSGKIIRPLLFARKAELEIIANLKNLEYTTDSSNLSDKYTRNYFRHKLIPVVNQVFEKAEDNLLENIDRFNDVELLYREIIAEKKKKLLEIRGEEVHIPVLKLAKLPALKTIVFEVFKEYGFTAKQVPEICKLLDSESGRFINSKSHRLLRNRKWLIISRIDNSSTGIIVIDKGVQKIKFERGQIYIDVLPVEKFKLQADATVAQLDFKSIQFPMLLRKWKQGDYFYPLGMAKKKKLSKFFIDQKVSRNDKEKIFVVEMNKKIIWVMGMRIDDRFKVLPSTTAVLELKWVAK